LAAPERKFPSEEALARVILGEYLKSGRLTDWRAGLAPGKPVIMISGVCCKGGTCLMTWTRRAGEAKVGYHKLGVFLSDRTNGLPNYDTLA
jgi:hypothetical protein